MRPKSEIYTPKRDDEHPFPFYMGALFIWESPLPPGSFFLKGNKSRMITTLPTMKMGSLWLHVAAAEEPIRRKGTVETLIDVHKCSHMQPLEVRGKGQVNNHQGLCKFAAE